MTTRRWAALAAILAACGAGLHAVAVGEQPVTIEPQPATYVLSCQDPGLAWCGGNVHSIVRYAPDGHYRDDGSIPLAGQTAR